MTIEHLKNSLISDAIAVAMATMTFQYAGYFRFKLIKLENKFDDP